MSIINNIKLHYPFTGHYNELYNLKLWHYSLQIYILCHIQFQRKMYVHYVQNININSIIFLLITVVAMLVKHPQNKWRSNFQVVECIAH